MLLLIVTERIIKNGNAGNGDKFKEINEAYQTLGNKDKRAQYDQFGSAYQNMGGAGGGNPFGQGFGGFDTSSFSDIFALR